MTDKTEKRTNKRNKTTVKRQGELYKLLIRATQLPRSDKIMLAKSLAGQVGMLCNWPSGFQMGGGGGESTPPKHTAKGNRNSKKPKATKPKQTQKKSKFASIPEFRKFKELRGQLRKAKAKFKIPKQEKNDPRIQELVTKYQAASEAWFAKKFTLSDTSMTPLPKRDGKPFTKSGGYPETRVLDDKDDLVRHGSITMPSHRTKQ